MTTANLHCSSAIIRPAAEDDLPVVTEIFSHYVTSSVITFAQTPPNRDDWRQVRADLADRGLPFLVTVVEGEVVGYAYASPWRSKPAYRHTVESSIYLAPGWTGRGLGRQLLDVLLDECTAAGLQQVIAVVADTGDPASSALHRACGFSDAGRLCKVGSKHGRILDTALFQYDLVGKRNAKGRDQ